MREGNYVEKVNQNLERLLVFETVFKEYVHTCQNIEKGNCYASENFENIQHYFTKNVMRFCSFVKHVENQQAPASYAAFHDVLVQGLEGIQTGVLGMLQAISKTGLNHEQFDAGLSKQKQARDQIDSAFAKILDPIF